MIRDVEEFRAELQADSFRNGENLVKGEIYILEAWAK